MNACGRLQPRDWLVYARAGVYLTCASLYFTFKPLSDTSAIVQWARCSGFMAFDKVPHTRLMSKLRILGIDGKVCRWIKAFLDDRTQKVCIDGHLSSSSTVQSGVPQCTVLGPLLFLCFINDLPSVVDPNTQVRLFADDCLQQSAM